MQIYSFLGQFFNIYFLGILEASLFFWEFLVAFVPSQKTCRFLLEHNVTIYELFVICFNNLNGPLSRLTTQNILANIRFGGYYDEKVFIVLYFKYLKVWYMCLKSVNAREQASDMLILFIFEYE